MRSRFGGLRVTTAGVLLPGLVHRLRARHLRHVLAERRVGNPSRARRRPAVHQAPGIVQPEIRKTGTFERSSAFL